MQRGRHRLRRRRGGFLILLGTVWGFAYDRLWHAIFHAAVVGSLSHLLLQITVIVQPAVPFSNEPRRGQQSGRLLGVLFGGSIGAALVSFVLPFVYRSAAATGVLVVLILGATAALEYTLRRRVAEAIAGLEFGA